MRKLLVILSVCLPLDAQPQPDRAAQEYIKANYTKYEYRIPVRDGKRLFTSVYIPKDQSQKYPILLNRTPYSVGPYGEDRYRVPLGPSEKFYKEGFIFALQDVRGRFMSEGTFIEMRPHRAVKKDNTDVDESTDTYDTIDWLVKHVPNNNGRVGTYGTSYPGFYTAAGMIDAHPAHKAASPQAPMADLYFGDDAFHHGAFKLAHNFGFYGSFKPRAGEPEVPRDRQRFDFGTPDGWEFYLYRLGVLAESNNKHFKGENGYWYEDLIHTTYDEYWKSRNLLPHLKNIKPAVMTVGGWFDAEDLAGPQNVFRTIERNNPPAVNMIVEGPWSHGGWNRGDGDRLADVRFDSKTSAFFRDNIEFPFFLYHLKGKGDANLPKAYVFETGTNVWRKHDAWPPRETASKTLYLRAGGKLSFDPPAEDSAYDEYLSDPNRPVPIMSPIVQGMSYDYMTADQRYASRRPDVLVYQTDALEEAVTVGGPVGAVLHVSTTGTDSDFIVKLIDVYPDDYAEQTAKPAAGPERRPDRERVRLGGYQQLVRGEPFRGKFRNSFEKPEPFVPGRMAKIDFETPGVYHTFRRGHRIMVQISSTWFPVFDRNPQKFMEIPKAKPEDFQKAAERVYRSKGAASAVRVGVLGGN